MTPSPQEVSQAIKTCKRGHRYDAGKRTCPVCSWNLEKVRRQENRKQYLAVRKRYRDRNKQKLSSKFRRWYDEHAEDQRVKKRQYVSERGLWNIWYAMIRRCSSPNDRAFKHYGGRGITVCERWLGDDGYENFVEDMGERPSPEHSIDRRNNDLGYSPENCWWRTPKQQSMNRRSSRMLTFNGRTQCMAEWAEEIGISPSTLSNRLNNCGWSVQDALTKKVFERR